MKSYLSIGFLALLVLISGCDEQESVSKRLDFEYFIVEVPANWNAYSSQGYDSKTGGVTNRKTDLKYDFGWFAYNPKKQNSQEQELTDIVIDGREATIAKPLQKGEGILGIFIEVDDLNNLWFYGENIQDEATVLAIFQSIKFKD